MRYSAIATTLAALLLVTSGCGPSESQASGRGRPARPTPKPAPTVVDPANATGSAETRPLAESAPAAATSGAHGKSVSFLNDRLTLLVPAHFELLSSELVRAKYPSDNRPKVVYGDEDAAVNVAVSHTKSRVTPTQLPTLFRSMLNSLKLVHGDAEWFQSELGSINGRQFFLIDFRTRAVDTDVRNVMLGTSFQGRMLLITFNMTRELEDIWLPFGNTLIESIELDG